ncbi:MAG: capsule biosynthesis protein [Kordiimonas sp.]
MCTLANKLAAEGARVHRVNYCGGDWWFSKGATKGIRQTNFLGKHGELAATYQKLFDKHAVTTIILFGDCRPIHKIAIETAQANDIEIVVFEEGYTRPNWITCEYGGTNDRSNLPRTATAIRKRAEEIDFTEQPQTILPNPMPPRVKMDLQFHASNIGSFWYFHNYQTHRPEKVSAELKGWISRFWRKRKFGTENDALVKLYETTDERYFLVPLQLTSDFQIREHSDYDGVPDFIGEVIASFAKNASSKDRLLIKSHPLDNGMIDYRSLIGTSTVVHGISDRVAYIEGGDLDILLSKAEGVVLINSTVGYAALKAGKPMKVMGRALYDIEGLTHQEPIDTFWKKPSTPDPKLTEDFLKVVRHDSQIYGDFFTDVGMELATDEASKRLMVAYT